MSYRFFFFLLVLLSFSIKAQPSLSSQYQKEAIRFSKISEFDSAACYYEKAISMCKSCSDTLKARLYLSLFKTYMYAEKVQEAFQQLTKAENHAKKDQSDEYLSLTIIGFAEYFRSVQKFEKADEYIDKALVIISKGKVSDRVLAEYYNRKAAILSEGYNDLSGVIAYSKKNIALARKMNNKNLEAVSLNEIGFAYEKMGGSNLENSIKHYLQALEIWEKTGDDLSLVNILGNLVRVYIKTNQYDLALVYNKQGYKLAEEKKIEYSLVVFTYQQYEIYRNQNKVILALETIEKYEKLNSAYREKNWVKVSARAEYEYETQKKDQELKINQLKLKNRELELKKSKQNRMYFVSIILFVSGLLVLILLYSFRTKRTNKKLQLLLIENKFLLGESNHRIKNNLQLI